MRRNLLILILFLCVFVPLPAQYVWLADFTPASGSDIPAGWTTIKDPNATGHWSSKIYNNSYTLYCQEKGGGTLVHDPVKKEWIISPTISINNDKSYGVRFNWQGHPTEIFQNGVYDFHLAVSEDNGENWQTIWSASNKEDLEKSGVLPPWNDLASIQTSTVSLKDYGGKDIKIAYIYDLKDTKNGNMIRISTMGILPHDPVEGPMVGGSSSYTFSDSYMGVKEKSSETLHLINRGIGTLEITAIEGLEGTDYSTDLVPSNVKLTAQQTYNFNVYYTPTPDGARSATMVIKTNGGDHSIQLDGTKLPVPTGYVLESFEGYEFPPAGWENTNWSWSSRAGSGDKAVSAFFVNDAELTTPVIDISAGNYDLTFDYAVSYDGEYIPDNVFRLEQSDNEGRTWRQIWTTDVYEDIDYTRVKLKVGGTEVSRFRWVYEIKGQISFEGEYSTIYLDNIITPVPVGANTAPVASPEGVPINGDTEQAVNELLLTWRGVLHADGYRVYLGTNINSLSLVATTSADDRNIYEANGLNYNTTYYWKVVPYNSYGEATNVPVWNFRTMTDQTIRNFPYFQGFEGDEFPELGWRVINNEGLPNGWYRTDISPYSGKYSAIVNCTRDGSYSILQSPEIFLPIDQDVQITFVWGNGLPANLSRAPQQVIAENESEEVRGDTLYFEVKTPATAWEKLAICTQKRSEQKKWVKEKVDLSKYKGERVTLRWRQSVYSYDIANGGGLDDIEISVIPDKGVPVVTFREWYRGEMVVRNKWNAGILNYKEKIVTENIFALLNDGPEDLEVQSVRFNTSFFETNLGKGVVIRPEETYNFGLSFIAVEHQDEIKDSLFIEFVDGQVYKFPIEASAMGRYSYCYTFEDARTFATDYISDFRTVDEDGMKTLRFGFDESPFPGLETPYAFMVMDWTEIGIIWPLVEPRSGTKVLMASSAPDKSEKNTSDWLISKEMYPLEDAQLRFYARSMIDSYMNTLNELSVYVSTTDDDLKSFEAVPSFVGIKIPGHSEVGEYGPDTYTESVVDLSAYKNQRIYVAIRHSGGNNSIGLLLDDIYFENFNFPDDDSEVPTFSTLPITEGKVGEPYVYNFTVRDPDGDIMSVNVLGMPDWMKYEQVESAPGVLRGTLSGTPVSANKNLIRIEVSDGKNEAIQQFTLEITEVNAIDKVIQGVNIYPNPVTSVINIDGQYEGTALLFDLTGNRIYEGENVSQISVENLSPGMYILRIQTKSGIYTTNIIKK